jgi:nucleoid-associated protein YgaU
MFEVALDIEHMFGILPGMSRTRVRYRRAGAILVCALAATALRGGLAASGAPSAARVAQGLYVVRAGDTVWSVAARFAGSGDPRPVVDALIRDNYIRDAQIWPGQRLRLGG